jgi:hypothetical protein
MTQGFVMLAIGKDYVKQAYTAALSIRANGNTRPVSLITSTPVTKKQAKIFDQIIEIPWYADVESRFQTEHRWKIYHASPYEQTIVLDTDILVQQNLDNWWSFLDNYELYFTSKVFTYRQDLVTNNFYRKAFEANNLPNVYCGLHYFKKSNTAHEFFKWVELITNNWELFYGKYCSKKYPKQPSMDITCAIAIKILHLETSVINEKTNFPMFVHMKPRIQKWQVLHEAWQNAVPSYLTDELNFYIGNYIQTGVIHYTEKDFLTDKIITKYENKCKIT